MRNTKNHGNTGAAIAGTEKFDDVAVCSESSTWEPIRSCAFASASYAVDYRVLSCIHKSNGMHRGRPKAKQVAMSPRAIPASKTGSTVASLTPSSPV